MQQVTTTKAVLSMKNGRAGRPWEKANDTHRLKNRFCQGRSARKQTVTNGLFPVKVAARDALVRLPRALPMISPACLISRLLATVLLATLCAGQPLRAQESPESAPHPTGNAADEGARTETIVFIRHGEKPANDEGQLTCQGLNRALALPDVLVARYGAAQYVFAPATTKKPVGTKSGAETGTAYSYVRPLMTIEPTAIRLGLPVETKFAFDEIGGLQSELTSPAYQRALVFVAWEHRLLDQLVKRLMTAYGNDAAEVPDWPGDDYDSIFVVRIRMEGGKHTVTFAHEQEGLNGMSTSCPQPRKP